MWTTDTFLQNLASFSALKGQDRDNPTAVYPCMDGRTAVYIPEWRAARPYGPTNGRHEGELWGSRHVSHWILP